MASFGIGPSLANYGSRGRSPSLVSFGEDQQAEATSELSQAAAIENQRNAQNKVAKANAKQGNMALGSAVGGLAGGAIAGATYGTAAGPWGSLIGGVLGAVAGGLFD